jgi:phosphatidylglycerophosphatase A
VGTLVVGVPLCLIFQVQSLGLYALSVLTWTVLGVWAADRAASLLKHKDPPSVVLDEVVGFLVTLTGVGVGVLSMTLGFVLFRFYDIVKVPPIRWIERKLPGGLGIMVDDVVAGIYANISLRVLLGLLNESIRIGE